MGFWRDEYGNKRPIPIRVLGYPFTLTYDCPPDKLYFYDGGFHAHPDAQIPYNDFWKLYTHLKSRNLLPKEEHMSSQLLGFDEQEHDRTGGPTWRGDSTPPESDSIGTPLQEQVELVEDALSKALAVIEAFVEQEKELRDEIYHAQVDAQEWQNKYFDKRNDREWDALLADRDMFREEAAALRDKYNELTRAEAGTYSYLDLSNKVDALETRVYQLTHDNTQLELRNERQRKRLDRIQYTLQGTYDNA